jgi:hypothetical protein
MLLKKKNNLIIVAQIEKNYISLCFQVIVFQENFEDLQF